MQVSPLDFSGSIIAHRGASFYAPENTMSSFVKAAQFGASWVEFDVMLAACGTPIVFHDEELMRITQKQGMVNDYPYTYLQTLDAGSWFNPIYAGEQIPRLRTVLTFLASMNMAANVELKPLPGQELWLVKNVLAEIKLFLLTQQMNILFSSFSITVLKLLRQFASNAHLGLLMHTLDIDWQHIADDLQCSSINVYHEIMTPELANAIQSTERKILCYTVNNRLRAETLFSWGVDGLFSDIPNLLSDH